MRTQKDVGGQIYLKPLDEKSVIIVVDPKEPKNAEKNNSTESILEAFGISSKPTKIDSQVTLNRLIFAMIFLVVISSIVLYGFILIQDNEFGRLETETGIYWLGAKAISIGLFVITAVLVILLLWLVLTFLFKRKT